MYSRSRALLLAIGLIALLLSACAAPAAAPAGDAATDTESAAVEESSDGDEAIELRVAWWGSQDRNDRTVAAIELYEQENPGITVSPEFAGWGDYWTKLTTQGAGGNLPCVVQHYRGGLTEWVDNGLLMPLDDLVDAGLIDFTNVAEGTVDLGRIDGALYGVDLGDNSQTIVLDVDAFEKAGLDLPARDWTWDEFEETATALHETLDIWGMGPELTEWQVWDAFMRGYDASGFSEDGAQLGYSEEQDQHLIDQMNRMLRLQEAGVIMPVQQEIAEQRGKSVEDRPIVSGKAAMDYFWSNQLVAVWTAAGEGRNLVLYHLPRPEGGSPSNFVKSAMMFTVTSQCEHPEQAAQFIDFFTNSVAANEILLAERGVPISSEVQAALKPLLGPAQTETVNYLALVAEDGAPAPLPFPAAAAEISSNVYYPEFIDPVLLGMISPEEGVATFREMATEILAE